MIIDEQIISTSEDPDIHWSFIEDPLNKTILDLGCNSISQHMPTPEWFLLRKNAKSVVGVDMKDYNGTKELNNFIFINREINSAKDLENLLVTHSPDIVKCDIEEAEKYFLECENEILQSPSCYAIEYHYDTLEGQSLIKKFEQCGFTRCIRMPFKHYPSSYNLGVVFFFKI